MRTNATTAWLPVGDAHDPPATTCIKGSIQRVRPIEAWLTREDARQLREHLRHCEEIDSGVYRYSARSSGQSWRTP